MKKVLKKMKDGRTLYYEKFGSYQEYVKTVEERTTEEERDGLADGGWSGASSYKEAKDMLINGWDKQVELVENETKKELEKVETKKTLKIISDVQGCSPIVPNALMGLPNSMINCIQNNKKTKIIKFMIGMNRSCQYGSDEIIRKMSKILARIIVLERNGYRCRLELFGCFNDGDGCSKNIACHSILIKSENQLFDIKRLCYPIVHSSMQRVFGFAWEKHVPYLSNYHCGGLGRAIQYWSKSLREELQDKINENKEKIIFVSIDTNIDEMFGKGGEIKDGK